MFLSKCECEIYYLLRVAMKWDFKRMKVKVLNSEKDILELQTVVEQHIKQ